MRMPHVNLSPESLSKNFCFYLLIRLQAVPEVAKVLEFYEGVRTGLLESIAAHEAAVDGRRAAMARRDFYNDRMEQEIRVLAFTILGVVNNNRNAPAFRHYFPSGYGDIMDTPALEQRRRSIVLLEKLQAEQDEMISTRLESFQTRLEEFEKSLTELEDARDLEARTRANRETAKVIWLDGYRRTHGLLQDRYSADPRRAESFFREVRAQSRRLADDDVEFVEDLTEASTVDAETDDEDLTDSGTPSGGDSTGNTGASDLTDVGDILGIPGVSGALRSSRSLDDLEA